MCTGMTAIAHGTDFGGSCRTATGIAAFPNDQSDVLLIDGKPLASIIDYIAPTATMSLFGLPALSIHAVGQLLPPSGVPKTKGGAFYLITPAAVAIYCIWSELGIPARRAKASSEP